ncbi:hypothetical protein EK904_004974 [Melospiza melodia maxima]|nr:hypothetical protein EK904_004974 [Melospiza melodia maxima]
MSTVEELFHCCSVLHITFWPSEYQKTQEPFMAWNVSSAHESSSGNQRELARQKNLKKTQEIHKGKRKEDSLSASQRKQRTVS